MFRALEHRLSAVLGIVVAQRPSAVVAQRNHHVLFVTEFVGAPVGQTRNEVGEKFGGIEHT